METFQKMTRLLHGLVSILIFVFLVNSVWASICPEPFKRHPYPTRKNFCNPGTRIADDYDIPKLIKCEDMEVDHLFSLRQAYDSGICGEKLKAFAKDPRNLRVTHWKTNRAKASKPPENFLKSLKGESKAKFLKDLRDIKKSYPKLKSAKNSLLLLRETYSEKNLKPIILQLNRIKQKSRKIVQKRVGKRLMFFSGKKLLGWAALSASSTAVTGPVGVGAAATALGIAGGIVSIYTVAELASFGFETFVPDDLQSIRAQQYRILLNLNES